MQKKNIQFFLLAFVFIFSSLLVTAEPNPPFQQGINDRGIVVEAVVYSSLKLGENFTQNSHAFNSTTKEAIPNENLTGYVHIYNSKGEHILVANLTPLGTYDMTILIDESNFTKTGVYSMLIYLESNGEGDFFEYVFNVTLSGLPYRIELLAALIAFIILMVWGMIWLQNKVDSIDLEKRYNKLVSKYEEKSTVELNLKIIGHGIYENLYAFHFLIGFLLVIAINDLAYLFNLINIYPITKLILSIYPYGAVIIFFYFFGQMIKLILKFKDDLIKNVWGIDNGKK